MRWFAASRVNNAIRNDKDDWPMRVSEITEQQQANGNASSSEWSPHMRRHGRISGHSRP
jgi:hypothetical protein